MVHDNDADWCDDNTLCTELMSGMMLDFETYEKLKGLK